MLSDSLLEIGPVPMNGFCAQLDECS